MPVWKLHKNSTKALIQSWVCSSKRGNITCKLGAQVYWRESEKRRKRHLLATTKKKNNKIAFFAFAFAHFTPTFRYKCSGLILSRSRVSVRRDSTGSDWPTIRRKERLNGWTTVMLPTACGKSVSLCRSLVFLMAVFLKKIFLAVVPDLY